MCRRKPGPSTSNDTEPGAAPRHAAREIVRIVVRAEPPAPQKLAKSCVPTSHDDASRAAARSSGSRTQHAKRSRSGERNGWAQRRYS